VPGSFNAPALSSPEAESFYEQWGQRVKKKNEANCIVFAATAARKGLTS
jgi:hypothetical protein